MKRLLTSIALSTMSLPALAIDATPLFSFNVGAGVWNAELSGSAGDSESDISELGLDESSANSYIYATLEQPIPGIPNFRVEHTTFGVDGEGVLNSNFSINGDNITAGEDVFSELDLAFTDLTLYYELAMFDFGVTLRQVNLDVIVTPSSVDDQIDEGVSAVIPLGYLQTRVSLPLTGLFVTGAGHVLSVGENSVTDLRAAIGYEQDFSFVARVALEAGYRAFNLSLSDDTDFESDIDIAGPYLGLDIKF